jgi:hypothetical protein
MKSLKVRGALFCSVCMLLAVFTIYSEVHATTHYLSLLSFILLIFIMFSVLFLNNSELVSPLSFFSVMYFGYVVGGYYYAQSNGYFGKFIGFVDLSRAESERYLMLAMLFSIVCYIFFVVGYSINNYKKTELFIIKQTPFTSFVKKYYLFLSLPLVTIGFIYWVWVSNTIAGGIIDSLILFQIFPHLVEEYEISTAPYLFYYAGVYVWLLGVVLRGKKVSSAFVVASLIGLIISLSTARITISVTYILAQLVFYYLVCFESRRKIFIITISLLASAFVVFFLRELSNYYYLHDDIQGSDIDILRSIVGGGNVTDLQQLVIIFYSFDFNNALLGLTYFDWLRNSIGVLFGMEPSSVGLIIAKTYVPSTSGAPTPGAIGEAYANFSFATPIFIFLVGYSFSYIHAKVLNSSNIFMLFTYSTFLVCFVFMYPKVDSTMITNFFWGSAPTLFLLSFYYCLYLIIRNSKDVNIDIPNLPTNK